MRKEIEDIIIINKLFHDGSVRYIGDLEFALKKENKQLKTPYEIFKKHFNVAQNIIIHHPFFDGNKRTAIKYLEIQTEEIVPSWVYLLLEDI